MSRPVRSLRLCACGIVEKCWFTGNKIPVNVFSGPPSSLAWLVFQLYTLRCRPQWRMYDHGWLVYHATPPTRGIGGPWGQRALPRLASKLEATGLPLLALAASTHPSPAPHHIRTWEPREGQQPCTTRFLPSRSSDRTLAPGDPAILKLPPISSLLISPSTTPL